MLKPFVLFLSFTPAVLQASDIWVRFGPYPEDQEAITYNIGIFPHEPTRLIAGTRPDGLMLSEDDGQTWRPVTQMLGDSSGNVGANPNSLAIAPSNPAILYAGIETKGIYKSSDHGETWKPINEGIPKGRAHNGVSVAIHPQNADIVYLGTDAGLFKSIDGGAKWERLSKGLPSGKTHIDSDTHLTVQCLRLHPLDPDTLYLGLYAVGHGETAGVYRSQDGGETWTAVNDGLLLGSFHEGDTATTAPIRREMVFGLEISAKDPAILYVGTLGGCFRSNDHAANWQATSLETPVKALAISPEDPLLLAAATTLDEKDQIVISRDGGKSWENISGNIPLGVKADAPRVTVNFTLPDGSIQELEGIDKRHINVIESLYFDPRQPKRLIVAGTAGLYFRDL